LSFFYSHPPPYTEIYTLSLHDALPISIRHHRVETRLQLVARKRANGLAHLIAERRCAASARALAGQEIGHDCDESLFRQLVADAANPIAHAADVVHDDDDGRFGAALGIDHEAVDRGAVRHL